MNDDVVIGLIQHGDRTVRGTQIDANTLADNMIRHSCSPSCCSGAPMMTRPVRMTVWFWLGLLASLVIAVTALLFYAKRSKTL